MLDNNKEIGGALDAGTYTHPHDIVELVVLTTDDPFLRTLRDAVGSTRRLWHVATPDKVSDLLIAGNVGILVLDAQGSRDDPARFIAEIKEQFPDLVIIVAGDRGCEMTLLRQISAGTIYRFIHKPMSPARAKLFAEAAVRKFDQQRRLVPVPAPVVRRARVDRRLWAGGAIGVGVGALVIAAGLLLSRGLPRSAPPPTAIAERLVRNAAAPSAAPSAAAADGASALHESLLERAENALLEERLADAEAAIQAARAGGVDGGRVAFLDAELAKLRQRQAGAPVRAAAVAAAAVKRPPAPADGRRTAAVPAAAVTVANSRSPLAVRVLGEARAAIERREFERAAGWIDMANGVAAPADVDSLRQALDGARRAAPAAAGGGAAAAAASPGERLLKSMYERLDQDRLIEPAGDSAKSYFAAARDADPGSPALVPARQALGARLVASARQAMAAGQWDAARHGLDEAAAIGYGSADAAAANQELGAALGRQAAPPPTLVAANTLEALQTVAPRYPLKALQSRTEGWVELDFTVAETGAVKNIEVHRSSSPGMFEQAARDALAQWRYKPVLRDSKPVEQRARVRIRFSLA